MEASLIFLYIIFFVSILLLFIAGIIIISFVIPLQYQEYQVKNGLATLRRQMLLKEALALGVIIFAIFCLTGRFFIHDVILLRYIITPSILLFSIGILGKAIIDYQIYHQQYNKKNIEIHKKIEELERKKASKNARIDKKNKK